MHRSRLLLLLAALGIAACSHEARLPVAAGMGPEPTLPAPDESLLPTVNVAVATGWPAGGKPTAGSGLAVTRFADGLQHPRWIHVLPNGDVLVAETNAPPKPEDGKGIRAWAMKLLMKKAGAGTPSANRITLLRDSDGDGIADQRSTFLQGLNSPFGMALVGNDFYVADTDAVLRLPYAPGQTQITAPATRIIDLPAGPINHHWTKNLIASADGRKLYVTVGSNSNVGENGIDKEQGRAAIWEVDIATGAHRIFASGLRNPNGLAWEPESRALWTAVNERDELGSDLVPDYMTAVATARSTDGRTATTASTSTAASSRRGPISLRSAIAPDYALGPHTASLGLAWGSGRTIGVPLTRPRT